MRQKDPFTCFSAFIMYSFAAKFNSPSAKIANNLLITIHDMLKAYAK